MPPLDSEYSDTFASDVAGEIGADLFASEATSDPNTEIVSSPEKPEAVKPAPQENQALQGAVVQGQNSQLKALPKSWKKDMAPLWEKMDPAVHDYVYAREADVMRGLQQYQQGYQQWDALLKPYASVLQENPNVNPVQLMHGLMDTHLYLLNPAIAPQEKAARVQQILRDYNISLDPSQQPAQQPPEMLALQNEVRELRQILRSQQQQRYQAGVQEHLKFIQNFAADPKNEFFSEVMDDIHRLIQTGAATDVPSAYEMACWSNPAVRAKMLAKQQAIAPQGQRDQKGRFVNLSSEAPTAARTRKAASIDDTIDGIVTSHFSKH